MGNAIEVARWFYKNNEQVKTDSKEGNVVVQKLCYYVQAMCLAVLGKPLFDDTIEAWKEGPVIQNVYKPYRWYTDLLRVLNEKSISKEEELILKVVNSVYGYKTSDELTKNTHSEFPWKQFKETASDKNYNPEITIDCIKEYYKGLADVYEANKENDFENERIYSLRNCNFAYNKNNIKNITAYKEKLLEIARQQSEAKSFNVFMDENGELVIYE